MSNDELLGAAAAAPLVGVCPRQLPELPIVKYDVRRPGKLRPAWRWRRGDLLAFREARKVLPGHPAPIVL